MTNTKKIISAAVLAAFSSAAFAIETDETLITINVTKSEFVDFDGSLAGNVAVPLNADALDGVNPYILGDLGVNSNVTGDCLFRITSANSFTLMHTSVAATPLFAGTYSVAYNGTTFDLTSNTNPLIVNTVVGCDIAPTDLTMTTPPATSTVSGLYQDVLTATVTSQ